VPRLPGAESAAAPASVKPVPTAIRRIRVSRVEPGKLLQYVKPVYPSLAKAARVAGVVELEAVIAGDGRLKEIHVRNGNPLLVTAAVEAVGQWVYQPTVLNGDPVEVVTSIIVTFTLQ
jgi:protein TonB